MTMPSVLIGAPVAYRSECPDVLVDWASALAAQDYDGERQHYVVLNGADAELAWRDLGEFDTRTLFELVDLGWLTPSDSRALGGPRSTGATQMRLAFLRNMILEWFALSDAAYLLMVDSDVVLAPTALRVMVEAIKQLGAPATLSVQIDNRNAEDDPPRANAKAWSEDGSLVVAPWQHTPGIYPVARSGACSLYTRSALHRRCRWDPRYDEEHEGWYDDLTEMGFRHWLLVAPGLADHRMQREASRDHWREELRRRATDAGEIGPDGRRLAQ